MDTYWADTMQNCRRKAQIGEGKTAPSSKLVEQGYELLPHPPYFLDLASLHFFSFPNVKKSRIRQKFEPNEGVIAAMEASFEELQKKYFSDE